jgi:polysaccharide export outer membrane protein
VPVEAGEYRIGPGDVLEVSVFGLDTLDRTVRVLRDGSISLPLLGALKVAGMSLQEAERLLERLLLERKLVNDPQVSFFVKEYVSRGVSVQGAVERPGVYQMIQQRTLLEILGEAGGLSGRDSERAGQQIFVIRETEDGEQTRIEIDSEKLVNQGRAELNIPLLPGDVVLVPFAQKHRVYVSGAVQRPGPVEYLSSEGITVLQAITAAGGPTERGNLSRVRILRQLADGSETQIVVNVKRIRNGKESDQQLMRNDTVVVGEWFL